jgi:hypothetical protein
MREGNAHVLSFSGLQLPGEMWTSVARNLGSTLLASL